MKPPWDGGRKVCLNGPGHMTKIAAMPIYGKNLKKSSFLSESSLCTEWVAKDPSFLHADSEDSDQTGQMPRLI